MYEVAVVTGTRADYGLLRPVLRKLAAAKELRLRLLVTGAHLSKNYGGTVAEIEADAQYGIEIAARFDILAEDVPGGRAGTAARTALCLQAVLGYFGENPPDVLLVLGDRYEVFAFAQGAALLGIPVAHISGGDVTKGADDDWFRHCITKMAKLHFPSCDAYRQRLLRMGEMPHTVFNVGGLGDENIRSLQLLGRTALAEHLPEGVDVPDVLVTFHPETAGELDAGAQLAALLAAVQALPEYNYLFTAANADAGGEGINAAVEAFCAARENAAFVHSLGALRYLSAMQHAKLVLGNSSSGVVETPSFGTPAVNIGHRQDGRLMPANVVCCEAVEADILRAMQTALSPTFYRQAHTVQSPYNGGDTSGHIVRILAEFLESGALHAPKTFYDGE